MSTKSPPRKRVPRHNGLLSQKDDIDLSKENIFCTRCDIWGSTCFLIMDRESCSNCCSTRVVEKLNLAMLPHPKPYKLHCLNEDGDFIVKNQVKIQFSIRNYNDEDLCDIVPMYNCHILLGRPWHFERQAIHNGLPNKITLYQKKNNLSFILLPQLRWLRIKYKWKSIGKETKKRKRRRKEEIEKKRKGKNLTKREKK